MALSGFDPTLVRQSISNVQRAEDDLFNALYSKMQSDFINVMANHWACNNAIKFFSTFKEIIDSLLQSADQTFNSVVESMNSAATNWAQTTGSEYQPVQTNIRNNKVSVDCVQESINNVRGIDYDNATNTLNALTQIYSEADSALSSAETAVNGCGFIGGSQEQNLINSLRYIKQKLQEAYNEIQTQVKEAINTTVTDYGDVAGKVEQAFTIQQ